MKEITVAYRCNHCAQNHFATIDLDLLEKEDFSQSASCGHCAVLIEKTESSKFKVTVPCVACPTPHRFTLTKALLEKDIFSLQCAYSGIDCFFCGDKDKVSKAIEDSDNEIARLLALEEKFDDKTVEESLGLSSDMAIDTEGMEEVEFYNPEISSDMLFIIKDMAYDGKLGCICGDKNPDIAVKSESIIFTCPKCKKSREFFTRSVSDRARLEELSEIIIK